MLIPECAWQSMRQKASVARGWRTLWVYVQRSRCDCSEDAMHHLVGVVEQKDRHPAHVQRQQL